MSTKHHYPLAPRTLRIPPPFTFLSLAPTTSVTTPPALPAPHTFLSLSPTTTPASSPFIPASARGVSIIPLLPVEVAVGMPAPVEHRRSSSVVSLGVGGRFLRLGHVGGGGEEGDWSAVE
ncbi:hypothetical protein VE01_00095 [Pseudogymnoascus verrucosus]|uniref:Uncharacterized protein n=1 Tax=Pseudogymnoascus verrucosus TaxID=342668 RepID=A0A2P2SXG6_9PEZI|nr:uncharacterized protein VE01_00095 [Pseudogymnoascus verrucosus]OBU01558.1 hypothetical protein VE01_00095 [Pseudogymnoascus verrucosus]